MHFHYAGFRCLLAPRVQVIQALGDQHGPVRESLLRLWGIIDAVRGDLQNTQGP